MIKLCIFDLDGTLIDSLPAISHFGNTALDICGFDTITIKEYNYFAGSGRNILLHRMLAFLGQDTTENYEKIGKVYDREYRKNPNSHIKPFDGIPELLDKLKVGGIKIAVLSNKPDNIVQLNINHLFPGVFDFVLGQTDDFDIKPAPDGALAVCKKLDILPSETLFIGDTDIDILTGKNANMKSAGVLWGFRGKEELMTAGADFIISLPCELNDILKIENEEI